jgi:hypothetical protein
LGRQLSAAERRFLIYALGGGSGHAVRGALLGAALAELGYGSRVLVPEGRGELVRSLGGEPFQCRATTSPVELRRSLEQSILEHAATDLVVDTFPEGLLGELDGDPPCVRMQLVLRARRDRQSPRFLRALGRYRRAYDLEPHLGWLCAPDADRVSAFGPVARRLKRETTEHDVLLVAGEPTFEPFFERLARRLEACGYRAASARPGEFASAGRHRLEPLLGTEALSTRVVVGPAGFNLTYELAALGVWHVAIARPRRYDDQALRAGRVAVACRSPEAVERRVLQLLASRAARPSGQRVRAAEELAERLVQ